jgi:Flp pilus assembly protein TadG
MDERNESMERGRISLRRWRFFRSLAGDRGGALVETAIALPLLSLLLVGASEFGLVDYEAIEVTNAARAGVQYGAQSATHAADVTGIQRAATADAPNITLGTTTVSTTFICSDGSNPTGTPPVCGAGLALETILTVRTQATFNPVLHIPGVTPNFALRGQATQKVLQ